VSDDLKIFYIVLLAAFMAALAWYIRGTLLSGKSSSHRSSSSSSSSSGSSSHRHHSRHRRDGKHCPGCGKMIDIRRSICQHCGNQFELAPGTEPHPDEVAKGIVPAAPPPSSPGPVPEK
jgi:hypothetical protein